MAMAITTTGNARAHTGRMNDPDTEVPERARRRQYSATYKLETLAEYDSLGRQAKGALLRREGLYTSLLCEWRKQRDRGALEALGTRAGRPPVDPVERENARLRQRVARLEGDLDKARKVIEVQGELSALLEELASDSGPTSGETK